MIHVAQNLRCQAELLTLKSCDNFPAIYALTKCIEFCMAIYFFVNLIHKSLYHVASKIENYSHNLNGNVPIDAVVDVGDGGVVQLLQQRLPWEQGKHAQSSVDVIIIGSHQGRTKQLGRGGGRKCSLSRWVSQLKKIIDLYNITLYNFVNEN